MGSVADLQAISSLFSESEQLHAEHEAPKASYGCDAPVTFSGPTPGSIGPPKRAGCAARKARAAAPAADANAIWDAAEVPAAGDDDGDDGDDGRPQPEYAVVYKQAVGAQDLFLGIDPLRHAGGSCADALVLRVKLPGAKPAQIDLDVRATFVRLSTPSHRLKVRDNGGARPRGGEPLTQRPRTHPPARATASTGVPSREGRRGARPRAVGRRQGRAERHAARRAGAGQQVGDERQR